jgi:CHAD domain-containing protein
MRELRGVFPPEDRQRFRDELRWLQQATGPVRDLDVHLADIAGYRASLPDGLATDLAPLATLLEQRRVSELRRMRRALRSPRRQQLRDDWLGFLAAVPALPEGEDRPNAAAPIGKLARARVEGVYARMLEMGGAIDNQSPEADLHELRKRGKELRYLLELFGGLFPKDVARPMVASLKDLQDVLGRFQDRAVQIELLRGFGDELAGLEGGPAALMALGLVIETLDADQRRARAEFGERFEVFASARQRAIVRDNFRKLPKVPEP